MYILRKLPESQKTKIFIIENNTDNQKKITNNTDNPKNSKNLVIQRKIQKVKYYHQQKIRKLK